MDRSQRRLDTLLRHLETQAFELQSEDVGTVECAAGGSASTGPLDALRAKPNDVDTAALASALDGELRKVGLRILSWLGVHLLIDL